MKEPKNTFIADQQRKRRRRLAVVYSLAFLGAAGLVALLGFVGKKNNDTLCYSVDILIEPVEGQSFITEDQIRKLIITRDDSIVGKPLREVNIPQIYDKVSLFPGVKKAHVHTTVDGRCVIEISQRMPIARLLNSDGTGFYLDNEGFTMPLSRVHTAKVPVFTGALGEKQLTHPIMGPGCNPEYWPHTYLDEVYTLTQHIRNDELLNALVEHVNITYEGKFEIIPRVGNHRIVLGEIKDLDNKFKKLITFYAHTLPNRDLNVYRKIDLSYDDQVVCVK